MFGLRAVFEKIRKRENKINKEIIKFECGKSRKLSSLLVDFHYAMTWRRINSILEKHLTKAVSMQQQNVESKMHKSAKSISEKK